MGTVDAHAEVGSELVPPRQPASGGPVIGPQCLDAVKVRATLGERYSRRGENTHYWYRGIHRFDDG